MKKHKNSFWNFVQNFWNCSGGFDICDEWYPNYSYFYSTLNQSNSFFKNIFFSYQLDLHKQNRGYVLSVYIKFEFLIQIASQIKVKSKKEAIRQSLRTIKEFQENKNLVKEIWLKNRKRIPILNDKNEWISTSLISDVANVLYKSNVFSQSIKTPFGIGNFYSLSFSNSKWHWKKYSLHNFGYGISSHDEILLDQWLALSDFDFPLKNLISSAKKYIKSSKAVFMNEHISGYQKAEKFLKTFYDSQFIKNR